MAVVVPPPFRSQPDLWGPIDASTFDVELPGPMTHMSYQYPPPPPAAQAGTEMNMAAAPSYVPDYANLPLSSDLDPRSSMDSSPQSLDRKLKRSMSTPSVKHGQPVPPQQSGVDGIGADAAALALASEKRRNKLGYHRTSVACGHCRRRKIRCIPSPADVQGRCVNCIRLKKECSFFPVDQQPPTDAQAKAGARSSAGPKIGSASSSPALPPGMPTDIPGQAHFAQLAIGPVQPMAPPSGKASAVEPFSQDGKGAGRNSFDYGHSTHVTSWMAGEGASGASKPPDLPTTWRSYPTESPVTSAFSPYTPTTPAHSSTWTGPVPPEAAREEISWSSYPAPPPRSMSFGTAESMNHQHQQYQTMPHGAQGVPGRAYERKSGSMSELYPHAIAPTIPELEPGETTSLEHQGAIQGTAPAHTTYANWQQPYGYAKQGEAYGNWYTDGGAQHMSPDEHLQQPPNLGPQGTDMYYSGR